MRLSGFAAFTAGLMLFAGGMTPALATENTQVEQGSTVSGLIVRYEDGVSSIAKNGEPTGVNLVSESISEIKGLGSNLYSLKFQTPVAEVVAIEIASRMESDPRIKWVDLDVQIATAFSAASKPFLAPRAASAPRSLSASRSSLEEAPTQPRIRLSWDRPSSVYGGEIVGYRVQFRVKGASTWRTAISNTGSSDTSVYVTTGLIAGKTYNFRVRAITSTGGKNVYGLPSNIATKSPRTTPLPVALIGGKKVIGPAVIYWVEQDKEDRGGYAESKVTYAGTARAEGLEEVGTVNCNSVRCRFNNLQPEVTYTIEIFASNPKGITGNLDEIIARDEFYTAQWHLRGEYGVSMPQAWHYSQGISSVVVAVIDSGIAIHPDLETRIVRNPDGTNGGYDFVSDPQSGADGDGWDSDPTDMGGDAVGGVSTWHGTHVAGILAAESNTSGVIGAAPKTKLLPIRALGRSGGVETDLIAAINWAAGIKVDNAPMNLNPAKVINLSLGSQDARPCSNSTQSAIDEVLALGITIVTAAGNSATSASSSYPGNCVGVINVGATSSNGDRANYSNFGPEITVSAPGGDSTSVAQEAGQSRGMIVSTWIDGANQPGYGIAEGTSMAAPIVSGVVALMYAMQPSITPRQVAAIIENSTKAFVVGGICDTNGGCGAGILDAHLALARASILR